MVRSRDAVVVGESVAAHGGRTTGAQTVHRDVHGVYRDVLYTRGLLADSKGLAERWVRIAGDVGAADLLPAVAGPLHARAGPSRVPPVLERSGALFEGADNLPDCWSILQRRATSV